jgi:hypothetical protein
MRVESPVVSQSLIDAQKTIEKKEVNNSVSRESDSVESSQSFFPSPFGSSGTYSLSSLKAAVDYHAKFLTVAENNAEAALHSSRIPQAILDQINGQ